MHIERKSPALTGLFSFRGYFVVSKNIADRSLRIKDLLDRVQRFTDGPDIDPDFGTGRDMCDKATR
ncbi:hypothetical protein C9413_01825 [Rhizobium sp. SEMIA 4085]|uniref:hypothetical protein n=1 Tax=Rhizobium gallicum TaxID=56730 RepID=UPI0014785901|nr:hypothetical protein [Rhizobium sp. SEMIA 4085]